MASGEDAAIMPLEEVAAVAEWEGFAPEDFAVFEIEGFANRMPVLRERLKPKLTQLGELLAARLSETWEETLYPQVAQHLRRTVNAPEETWVAFARSPKAYKPFAHFRVAISGEGVRALVFMEDDAEDKPTLVANLERNANALSEYLSHHPVIRAFDLKDEDGQFLHGSELTGEILRDFGRRLSRVKGQHASYGLVFASTHPILQNGPELLDALVEAAGKLKPLYQCGRIPDFTYTYTPEILEGI